MTADELLAHLRADRDNSRGSAPWLASPLKAAGTTGLHPRWAQALLEELEGRGHLVKARGEEFWLFPEDDASWGRAMSLPTRKSSF